jgi:hypothetical protein
VYSEGSNFSPFYEGIYKRDVRIVRFVSINLCKGLAIYTVITGVIYIFLAYLIGVKKDRRFCGATR